MKASRACPRSSTEYSVQRGTSHSVFGCSGRKGAEFLLRGHGVVAGVGQRGRSTECNVWRMWRMHRIMTENVIVDPCKFCKLR